MCVIIRLGKDSSEIESLQTELDFSKELLSEAKEKYTTLLSWAEMFDFNE